MVQVQKSSDELEEEISSLVFGYPIIYHGGESWMAAMDISSHGYPTLERRL
jgi:hypothetical protein